MIPSTGNKIKMSISILVILIAVITLPISLAACQKDVGLKEISDKEELQKITVVLDWVPNTNHTGVYVARENGYYYDEGLEVEIIQPSEGGSADLIAAGKGEFGFSYQEQVTYARTAKNPLPVVAIAAIIHHNTSGFASPQEKNIKTPADFEGKKYGGWGSPMEEAMLKGLMEKYGADYSKLEIVNIGASDFFTSVTKDVDFAWIYYGWDGVKAELENFPINFMLLQDLDPRLDSYTPVIIASEQTIKDKPDLIKKFLRTTEKGYQFAIKNPEKAAEILLADVSELDREMVIASQKYLSDQYISDAPKWGVMKKEIWYQYGNWMHENNLLYSSFESEKAFTNEFLPE